MDADYEVNARILKALSDSNRLKIIEMLSHGEKCACDLLGLFTFTQPTLSYHMKLLINCGLVDWRKAAQWNHYSLNRTKFNQVLLFLMTTINEPDDHHCQPGGLVCTNDKNKTAKYHKGCCD